MPLVGHQPHYTHAEALAQVTARLAPPLQPRRLPERRSPPDMKWRRGTRPYSKEAARFGGGSERGEFPPGSSQPDITDPPGIDIAHGSTRLRQDAAGLSRSQAAKTTRPMSRERAP